ncbi:uncharacterized protein MKZ38_001116 [Zalerion maritima]|uniref:HIT-type domain-containing protein n=1 Tax=Zalerion maritima TaxID=339359 RepID=A0AAD5WRN9_9PEZI|nr:uncharacterized protein MKZ38_001116 [Zalerion maritima]
MADPSLGSAIRCHICYIRQGIYKCPKCGRRSCSVTCVKTHKTRSRCSGERDPTEPKPLSWLRTPAGIDHDFNFLVGIERKIERNNKELVEAGLFTEYELRGYDRVEEERDEEGNIVRSVAKEMKKRLRLLDVNVRRVPRGMARARENNTTFCRTRRKGMNWQVEWLLIGVREHPVLDGKTLEGPETRVVYKAVEWKPLFRALQSSLEWFRRSLLTPEEKEADAQEKNRRRYRSRGKGRLKMRPGQQDDDDGDNNDMPQKFLSQSTETSAWSSGEYLQQDHITKRWNQEMGSPLSSFFDFYLHVPRWPSGPKKVVMPLRPTETLATALCGRTVVEFPTIYVFPANTPLPFDFETRILERKKPGWMKGQKQDAEEKGEPEQMDVDQDQQDQKQDAEDETMITVSENGSDMTLSSDDDTSSSESGDGSDSEEGEISMDDSLPKPAKKPTIKSKASSSRDNKRDTNKSNSQNPRGNQRASRGRGKGRGYRDNRGGAGGGGHGRRDPHPDQSRHGGQFDQGLSYNDGDGLSQQQGHQQKGHIAMYRGNRGNNQRGQRGRGRGGKQTPNYSHNGGRGGRSMSLVGASAVVPQKHTDMAMDMGQDTQEAAPVAKKQKTSGLVSYDSASDSAPEELGAVLGMAAGRDLARLAR